MNVWAPDTSGIYFSLRSQPEESQQRERICVCSGGSYPLIEFFGREQSTQEPEFVEVILAEWDSKSGKIIEEFAPQRACLSIWDDGVSELEIHPKTPSLLSNFQDRQGKYSSSFFFIIKIMTSDTQGGYEILDVVTTTTFRTVSHSKLCPVTRRGRAGHRPSRREKVCRDRSPVRLRKRVKSESSQGSMGRGAENNYESFESSLSSIRSFESPMTFEDFGVDDSIGLPLELF